MNAQIQTLNRLRLDADRLALVLRKARLLQQVYQADMQQFMVFLDDLLQAKDV